MQQQPLLPPQLNRSRRMMIIQKQPLLLISAEHFIYPFLRATDFEACPARAGAGGAFSAGRTVTGAGSHRLRHNMPAGANTLLGRYPECRTILTD